LLSEVSRAAPNAAAKQCLLFLSCAPADGWGLRIGSFSRKFRDSSAKERAKVKVHLNGLAQEALIEKSQSAAICREVLPRC